MTPKHPRTRPPTRKHRKVGQAQGQAENGAPADDVSVEIVPDPEALQAELDELTRWFDGTEPLPVDEAERALGRIHGTKDAHELAADRAEALTQIQVAEATLESLATPAVPVEAPSAEPPPAPAAPKRKIKKQAAHTERLRQVARLAVTASVNLRQAEAALERLPHPEPEVLAAVEQAQEAVGSARGQLDPARRRTVGALISATGMVIVISTVGWPASTYLVPTALVLVVTADMRVAGVNAKKTKERLEEELATFEAGSGVDLEEGRVQVTAWQEASARRDDAARRHAEAWAAWEEVAPGADPGDVEELIEAQAPPPAPEPRPAPPEPDPATERARVMAEQLIEDATRELAMIAEAEAELRLKERAERSLAWHQAKAALESARAQ